jgi:hypothetical protein
MANNSQPTFSFNFKEIITEEVALEGLEGIGLDLLWRRISSRISSPVTEKLQCRLWSFILKCSSINLYKNPVPVPHVDIIDRFTIIDDDTGDLKEPVCNAFYLLIFIFDIIHIL